MESKRIYIWIAAINLMIAVLMAIKTVPYFGSEWGDGYFAWIRTIVLCVHYTIHTSFLCLHCWLIIKKYFWLLPASVPAHIWLTYKMIPLSIFFWTYI